MAILSGFAPWIVYWILVGNVPFTAAVLVALAVAVGALVVSRRRRPPGGTLEFGSVAVFFVITVVTFIASQSFMERWIQPLSSAGIFLVALIGVVVGKPFVREFAETDQPKEVLNSDLFERITTVVTWIWVAAFAGMAVSSAIPPIVQGLNGPAATVLDVATPLSFVCYWVIPFVLLAAAMLAGRLLTDHMVAEATSPHTVRRSSFVAFKELGIDELLYLAKEKADREVGAGMEAYAVQIGGKGVPLTGDESRESWPVSYKVRERR
ncbi:hypothetical protein [Mycolicibacterium lacusdiani]|uniref:hypothetical protein n=1 Tax=Mycolicibacterium lacusdiani TaxID=2895283 RepID=UPI001F35DA9D|nr:hypothetical protein [Mycolicibacterium lacusdiani]